MKARLDEIAILVGPGVDIGLRTAVWVPSDGDITRKFNDIVREIAKNRSLTFYDFDYDVWSSVNFDEKKSHFLLRDHMHPKYHYTGTTSPTLPA